MEIIYKDKRGLEFKSAFFALIVFGMLIVSIGTLLSGWNTQYNAGLGGNLSQYDKFDQSTSKISGQYGNLSGSSSLDDQDFESTILRSVFGILNTIGDSFDIVFGSDGLLGSVSDEFGIPAWVIQGIVALMFASIVFTLIAIFFKLPRSSA